MPISNYLRRIREKIGLDLLLLPGVAALIRDAEGRVLIARRSDDGAWNLPSGAIDPGETPREALVREVREETGLLVEPRWIRAVVGGISCRHTYPNGDTTEPTSIYFECTVTGGALRSHDGEATEFKFVDPATAATLIPYVPVEVFRVEEGPAWFQ